MSKLDRQIDRRMDINKDGWCARQTDKKIDTKTDRRMDGQTNR